MQQQPYRRELHEFDTKGYKLHLDGSRGWHYSIRDYIMSPNVLSRSTMSMTSPNQLNDCQFSGQTSEMPGSARRQEHGIVAASIVLPRMGEYFVQENQQNQVGSSKMYTELHGMPHYGTASSFVMSEEPVYVNAKQYHAILRRRQLRAKAEMENKLMRVRKPYRHESRHLHALRRARGCGGRFINTKKPDTTAGNATHEECNSKSFGDSPSQKNFCSEPKSGYASVSTSGIVQPSRSPNDFMRLSLQESNCSEFFQWSSRKSFLSK